MPRSQIRMQDLRETLIDNYLKFLHPKEQQENPTWEEFCYAFCSKTRNARSQRQGT